MKEWVMFVCGVASVGKTVFSSKLAEKLGVEFIDLPDYVKEKKLYEYYDEVSREYVVDFRKISSKLSPLLKRKKTIIASIHPFKPRSIPVKLAIVLRLRPDILMIRLMERGYPEWKIAENILAEIVDKPLYDAIRKFSRKKVIQVDTSNKNIDEIVEQFYSAYISRDLKYLNVKVDWINELEKLDACLEILQLLAKYG